MADALSFLGPSNTWSHTNSANQRGYQGLCDRFNYGNGEIWLIPSKSAAIPKSANFTDASKFNNTCTSSERQFELMNKAKDIVRFYVSVNSMLAMHVR